MVEGIDHPPFRVSENTTGVLRLVLLLLYIRKPLTYCSEFTGGLLKGLGEAGTYDVKGEEREKVLFRIKKRRLIVLYTYLMGGCIEKAELEKVMIG